MISGVLKIIQNLIWAVMLAFLVLIGISFLPFENGLQIYTVQSGSMEPMIKTGSVIFVLPSKNYEIGDVVTRQKEGSAITVTHRIIEQTSEGFITKGDANDADDPAPLTQSGIVGKFLFQIPYLGYPIAFARTAQGLVLLIIIPSLFVIFDEGLNIKNELKNLKKKKQQPKTLPFTSLTNKFQYQRMNTPVKIKLIHTKCIPKDIRHICL